jgi:YidC/Oxa1 family membrane protein insertase
MATIPDNGAEACVFEQASADYLRTRMIFERFSVEPKGTWSTSHSIYMGPKDFGVLRDTGSRLEEAVDYGFFTVLARPLRAALAFFYGFVGNWGLAIIVLTLVIKLFTWPLTQKAYVNAERMKKLQPRIKELREKYENDQQRMSEETMKLMREEKVNPLGCLPLLIQMPILYGLFIMIYNSVELYHAEFLWYADLSAPDPIFLLPLLMGAVMFVQQRLTMQASAATMNPQMVTVMKIMPVMFTAFMIFLPAGLVLYYLLNLVLGVLQQFLIRRKFQKAEEAGEPTP